MWEEKVHFSLRWSSLYVSIERQFSCYFSIELQYSWTKVKAKWFCHKERNKVNVSQPHLVKYYNKGTGEVDLLDRLLGSYHLLFHSKKWCWNLFSNALNMVVVAEWILYSELHHSTTSDLTHLNFWREVSLNLLRMKPKTQSIPGPHAHSVQSVRQSNTHYLASSSQVRCLVCQKIQGKCVLNGKNDCMNTVFPLITGSDANYKILIIIIW